MTRATTKMKPIHQTSKGNQKRVRQMTRTLMRRLKGNKIKKGMETRESIQTISTQSTAAWTVDKCQILEEAKQNPKLR